MLECERIYHAARDMVRAALKNRDAESYLTNDSISGLDNAVRLLEAYIKSIQPPVVLEGSGNIKVEGYNK